MYAVCYGKWMSRRHYSRCWTFKGVSLKWNRLIRRNMKHALRYARRVNGLIKVLAENVVLMWKREPFGQMHIARWGQTCGDHYITYQLVFLSNSQIRSFRAYSLVSQAYLLVNEPRKINVCFAAACFSLRLIIS